MNREEVLKVIDKKFNALCLGRSCEDCPYGCDMKGDTDCKSAFVLDYLIEEGYIAPKLLEEE